MKTADPRALDTAVREAVGGDYRVTSTAIACGRRVAGKRTASRVYIVEGPSGQATVIREGDGFEVYRWGSGP